MHANGIRSVLKRFVPKSVLHNRKQQQWQPIRQEYAGLTVAEAFTKTYRTRLWGEAEGEEFCSGGGSDERFSLPYIQLVRNLIRDHKIDTVVDLGCGDFRVGRRLCAESSVRYVGVDIVADLVEHNRRKFGSERVTFQCANIIEDKLPAGDLCLVRQVLQHLSNAQIARVLSNCSKFPYVLITEDLYQGPGMKPNLDTWHGPDNRLFRRSGVHVEFPPYRLKPVHLLELPCPETSSVLRTSLIDQNS